MFLTIKKNCFIRLSKITVDDMRDVVVSSRIYYDVLYFPLRLGTFCSMNEINFF